MRIDNLYLVGKMFKNKVQIWLSLGLSQIIRNRIKYTRSNVQVFNVYLEQVSCVHHKDVISTEQTANEGFSLQTSGQGGIARVRMLYQDSVRSGRTSPSNLRCCPVRKFICPVRSSPNLSILIFFKCKIFTLLTQVKCP